MRPTRHYIADHRSSPTELEMAGKIEELQEEIYDYEAWQGEIENQCVELKDRNEEVEKALTRIRNNLQEITNNVALTDDITFQIENIIGYIEELI